MEVGQILTVEDLVNLVGTEKQKENYYKKNNIGTNVKKSLLKQLGRYCEYKEIRIKRKSHFEIIEIFNEAKQNVDKRCNNGENNKKFTKHLELSILNLCKNMINKNIFKDEYETDVYDSCDGVKSFTITKNNLMLSVGVINNTYKEYNTKRKDLAKELNAKIENIDNAYVHAEKLSKQVFTAMNKLRKSRNITYANAYIIEENVYMLDMYGQPICDENGLPITQIKKSVHPETTAKYDLIAKTEREVLNEMNIGHNILMFNNKLKAEFYRRLNKKLLKYRITKCYKVIKISVISTELLDKNIKLLEEDWLLCNNINNRSSYNIMIENSYNRNKNDIENGFGACKLEAVNRFNEEKTIYDKIIKINYEENEKEKEFINSKCYNGGL